MLAMLPQQHWLWSLCILLNSVVLHTFADPQSTNDAGASEIPEISPVSSNITNQAALDAAVDIANDFAISGAASAYVNIYNAITPLQAPETVSSAVATAAISNPVSVFNATLNARLNGLSIYTAAWLQANNASNIINNPTLTPEPAIFPFREPGDAPYSLSNDQLRTAIHIPDSFTYGQKPPVIIIPGAGASSNITFQSNLFKLFDGSTFADLLWIENPKMALADAQINAEYVAYAINFISGICNNTNVSIIAWSQGTADTQWALKYWPSTNNIVSDFVALSPAFHGTQNIDLLCPKFPGFECDPSLIQQTYNSTWITTLRENGGDSAYAPTTSVYSSSDLIIQPQSGTGASGFISDSRTVGVSNYEIQTVCAHQPGGSSYTHEGVLFHPLAYALIEDALTHPGPGNTSRLDLQTVCSTYETPGLVLADVLATESVFVVQAYQMLAYEPKVSKEPDIMPYAAGY